MHPGTFELRVAIRAPHRVVAAFLNVGNHFFPCAEATLNDFSRVINLIPPEMADVFMPCAASHPTCRTSNGCCHDEIHIKGAKDKMFGIGAFIVLPKRIQLSSIKTTPTLNICFEGAKRW